MTIHKYAFMTKIAENTHEVFFIIRLDDSDQQQSSVVSRFDEALSSGQLISGINATGKTSLLRGSIWNGSEFTLPASPRADLPVELSNGQPTIDSDGLPISAYALLKANEVFYISMTQSNSPQSIKFDAAFTNDVSFRKIEESDGIVSLGMIWNGSSWSSPTA
jgi:hypothetical protein